MTDDVLIGSNPVVSTLSGDEIPPLPDGEVPLCDADGSRIGTVHIDGDAIVATMCRTDRTGSATLSLDGKHGHVVALPQREDDP